MSTAPVVSGARVESGAPDVVDIFAGPGGWDEGLRATGWAGRLLGVELDPVAAATAEAAGHPRMVADVRTVVPRAYLGVTGVIGSPPCGPWSSTGAHGGRLDRAHVHARIAAMACGRMPQPVAWVDPRSPLSAEPMRWILGARPEWFAFEQVPGALDLFEHTAALASGLGYGTWSGVLRAEQHGVASTRRRAVLIGRRDGVSVGPPAPRPPVTMAQALGVVDDGRVLVSNYGTGGDARRRGRRTLAQQAPTMTGRCCRNRWEWPDGHSRNLTIREALQLQGFRADYPLTGGAQEQQQQVGDAVPPPLAAAVLAPLAATAGRVAA